MSDTDLIERLAEAVARLVVPQIPFDRSLMDTAAVGAYLKRSEDFVRREIVCLPTFPKARRIGPGRPQARYLAREVIKWAESQ